MLKFWKKKPAETTPPENATEPADADRTGGSERQLLRVAQRIASPADRSARTAARPAIIRPKRPPSQTQLARSAVRQCVFSRVA
jgi:hypothetical protein